MIDYKHAWMLGQGITPLAARMVAVSQGLMGGVYQANALMGSPTEPEELVLYPAGLDCVTFVETSLALALARHYEDYATKLKSIRYMNSEVNWFSRQHYFTQGLKSLVEAGVLFWPSGNSTEVHKELNLVAGLPPVKASYPQFDHSSVATLAQLQHGDIVAFASTRDGLDVFHCGLIALASGQVLLRHYSSRAGTSIEEPLVDFLGRSTMVGLVVARPVNK